MTVLRVDTIAGTGTTFGPTLDGNLEFNSQNYIVLPKGTSNQQGVLRSTEDVIGVGGTYYDNLVLAMPFNEATGLRDVSSRNRNPGTYGNVAISTAQSKYYGSSAYFDGTGDYLSIPHDTSLTFGSNNFTIELWINPQIVSGKNTPIVGIWDDSSTAPQSWVLYFDTNGNLRFLIDVTTNDVQIFTSPPSVSQNVWSHIAVTRFGSSWYMFINGVLSATGTNSSSISVGSAPLQVGTNQNLIAANTTYSGYIQDLRVYKGLAKYTANFTPPERIAELGVGFKTGQLRYNTDSNKVELYDGNQWTEVQSSRPDLNGGARGVFGGGYYPSNVNIINYITISSTGNAIDFGDLFAVRRETSSFSSLTRGVFCGGFHTSRLNILDFITISSTGDAQDFGDLSISKTSTGGCSSSTRGLIAGGSSTPSVEDNVIEYVTISSTGDSKDFGDLKVNRSVLSGCSNAIRGVFGGGITTPLAQNTIDFITISTLGDAQDFGDLTVSRERLSACSNSTRGIFNGGTTPALFNIIDYITISSTGNAINFGDLGSAKVSTSSCSSPTRGIFGGGRTPSDVNIIEYVTILTQGNAIDFGDLTSPRHALSALSNAHGGL